MEILIDDIGSFPLPQGLDRETFNRAYRQAREAYAKGENIRENVFIWENFGKVSLDAFKLKMQTGLDIVNYPQQYDGMLQVSDVVHVAMEKGTFTVEEKDAFLPEVRLISDEAKALSEQFGGKIRLRVSLFGPFELYIKEMGMVAYEDVLDGYAETIQRFARNSVLDTNYVKTEAVSIDEPSYGFHNVDTDKEKLISVLERAFDFSGVVRQIHLHSSVRLPDLLSVKNIDVVSFEYAASPKNIEPVSRKMLDEADKRIRVGVSRTDVDDIYAELYEKGVEKPSAEQLVEGEEVIRKRFLAAKGKYGERLAFTGPDCGLGSWPSQEAAALLLRRTVAAIKKR
jgi:5-methyltetrahydropteroyltriglutamate--homocysteine methyltransferase